MADVEFVDHVSRILGLSCDISATVRPHLSRFMRVRAVDAMDWVLRCCIGEMAFSQEREDEIPILTKYFLEYVGESNWTHDDYTAMLVLARYGEIKAKRVGGFASVVSE